jgi:hypothetical protein
VGSLGRRRRGGPGLQPRSTRATTTDGCSSTRIEEGSTEPFRRRRCQKQRPFPGPVPFTRRCSAHAARIRKEPGSFPPPRRASSNVPSSPRKRRRPREGDAERVDRRHGSSASSHGLHRPGSLLSRGAGATRPGSKRPAGGNTRWRAPGRVPARAGLPVRGSSRDGQPSSRRTRTEAAASRGGGFPARGRARASKCVAEIGSAVVAQRSRRSPPRLERTERRRWAWARSRVNISDGIARCPPERSRRRTTVRRTPS